MKIFTTRYFIIVTVVAIAVFIAISIISNFLLKTGPIVIQFGYPYAFYLRYGGYMSGQHAFNVNYLIIDILFAWTVVAIITFFYHKKLNAKK
jgi:hypothetical protein